VVLDACFPRCRQRDAARSVAARANARFVFAECRVSDATTRARLAERDQRAATPGWEAIAHRLEEHFEAPVGLPENARVVVRGDAPTSSGVDVVVDRLRAVSATPTPSLQPYFDPVPEVVSFDCWSTLLAEEDWRSAHALRVAALRDAAREAGLDPSHAHLERAFDCAWLRHMELWEQGTVSGAGEVASWALIELGLADSHPAVEHLVRRFEEASHTSRVVPLAGAKSLLALLDATGTACVLVCDTGLTPGRVVRRLLDGAGMLEHLKVLAFSDEVGFPKPDPRAFLAALEPIGADLERVVHVGDLRRTDVAGARALGMHTVRIRARHDDTSALDDADRVVDSHAQLAVLLGLRLPDVED
jgi:putative hydrolase of the HAD superfamily